MKYVNKFEIKFDHNVETLPEAMGFDPKEILAVKKAVDLQKKKLEAKKFREEVKDEDDSEE